MLKHIVYVVQRRRTGYVEGIFDKEEDAVRCNNAINEDMSEEPVDIKEMVVE